MALIDELKEMRAQARDRMSECLTHADSYNQLAAMARDHISDLDRAIAALEPPAEATPEPDEQASAQPDPAEGTPVPGAGEESRDHSDDASEFAEEGYAPVIDPEPATLIDAQTCEPVNPHPEPDTLADPIWNEPEPTKPEADALAKAADYYSPENVAERNRFDPFRMFKREDA